jgi:hypothetical protein
MEFTNEHEIKRVYVPNPVTSYRHTPSVPSLLNLTFRWHHNINQNSSIDDEDLGEILEFEKELESASNIKIDLGQSEMQRIISQMKSLNGGQKNKTFEVHRNKISGVEIPTYCDYLKGKNFN